MLGLAEGGGGELAVPAPAVLPHWLLHGLSLPSNEMALVTSQRGEIEALEWMLEFL